LTGLNLSDWALKHRSFIVFLMIAATVGGLFSYFRLGRAEDPPFTFRTMIVQAAWPGASMDDTLKQVTERIERKLQETKGLDFLRSYTKPGLATIFVNLKGSTRAADVPDIWYQVRKNIGDIRGTLPAGVIGPVSTTISATPSGSSTASRRTASRIGSCATMSKTSARGCCRFPTYRRSSFSAHRTSGSSLSSQPSSSLASASTARR
jgi:multidrug efflux pump subunit AcrB